MTSIVECSLPAATWTHRALEPVPSTRMRRFKAGTASLNTPPPVRLPVLTNATTPASNARVGIVNISP